MAEIDEKAAEKQAAQEQAEQAAAAKAAKEQAAKEKAEQAAAAKAAKEQAAKEKAEQAAAAKAVKSPVAKLIEQYRKSYPDNKVFYVTTDMQVFLQRDKNMALLHQNTLAQGEVQTVKF